jgi:hypothetical protein
MGISSRSAYNVKVAIKSGEVVVEVDRGLTGAGHPHLFLRSSRSAAAVVSDAGSWPVGLAWSVTDRLRNGGDEKGRVLAIWQELRGRPPVPVAALAWHAHESGPLYVLDAGCADAVTASVGRFLTVLLHDALLEAAAHRNSPVAPEWQRTLRWSQVALSHAPHRRRQQYRRENLRRAVSMGFSRHRPPPLAPHWASGAWLGERAF